MRCDHLQSGGYAEEPNVLIGQAPCPIRLSIRGIHCYGIICHPLLEPKKSPDSLRPATQRLCGESHSQTDPASSDRKVFEHLRDGRSPTTGLGESGDFESPLDCPVECVSATLSLSHRLIIHHYDQAFQHLQPPSWWVEFWADRHASERSTGQAPRGDSLSEKLQTLHLLESVIPFLVITGVAKTCYAKRERLRIACVRLESRRHKQKVPVIRNVRLFLPNGLRLYHAQPPGWCSTHPHISRLTGGCIPVPG